MSGPGLRITLFAIFAVALLSDAAAQVPGCTDSLASNYDPLATVNDGSCIYPNTTINTVISSVISDTLSETSGLILWNDHIWTHNDDTDMNLYGLDTISGSILQSINLGGLSVTDWEELEHDSLYFYLGDFGNNVNGNRTDLRIFRIRKDSLLNGVSVIDTIRFSYSDQVNFNPAGNNNTDFDCEAFIVAADSIYLFTKQWISKETSVYSLSVNPGVQVAQKRFTYDIQGLVTGSVFVEGVDLVALCGYSQIVSPFIFLLYDYNGMDYFSGNKRKLNLSMAFHQVEAIVTDDGLKYYLTNEKLVSPPFVNVSQKIHITDLSDYLKHYIQDVLTSMPVSLLADHASIYPVPANHELHVEIPLAFTGIELMIFDLVGRKVFEKILDHEFNTMDISELENGVYVVTLGDQLKKRITVIR